MEDRKIQSKKRYFLAFLIGTLIFLTVFGITYAISYFEYQRISQLNQELSYDIFKDKLDISLFNVTPCKLNSFQKISEDLRFQGAIIGNLEVKFGKNDDRVLFRKKFYSLVELEHFEFVKNMNKECHKNTPTILFFYSNRQSDLDRSEEVGRILDSLSNDRPEVLVYSFDVNLEDDLIKELMFKYNVTDSPTVVINEKSLIFDLQNIEDIEKRLK